jgi:hypothetical protein
MTAAWLAVSTPATTFERLEHDLHEARVPLDAAIFACTHVVDGRGPRLAASLRMGHVSPDAIKDLETACLERSFSAVMSAASLLREIGPGDGCLWARTAIERARAGREGRAIRFRGQMSLTGARSVAEILERSEIQRVEGLGEPVDHQSIVVTRDYLRPVFANGELVLYVTPLMRGRFQPFESAARYRCCEAA